jgi:signal transduction histidine kinase
LLTNAIKFSHFGGAVTIKVKSKVSERDPSMIKLSVEVQDKGIGMSSKD